MKINRFTCILLFLIISGCKKNNIAPAPTPPILPKGFSATINGVAWTPEVAVATIETASPSELFLAISGYDTSDGTKIDFSIDYFQDKAGTYKIGRQGNSLGNSAEYILNTRMEANSGTITLYSSADDTITGTFSFITDSATITNGQFNMPLTL